MSASNTSVPSITFGANGFVAPAETAIVTGVLSDTNVAFGANFNPALNTPQGQLASSLGAVIGDQNAVFIYLSSQTDPAYATGRMQDAIGRIYFLTRLPATSTIVSATLTGTPNATIPAGAQAQDANGYIYTLQSAVTLSSAGTGTGTFSNNQTGPIPCAANTLTAIYQAQPGWQTVTNPSDGVLGSNVESRQDFELRRQQSVAGNSRGAELAILAEVLAVSGVLDAYVVSNRSSSAATIGGVSVNANSLYVSVSGGTAQDIGNAIYTKAPPGIPTQGTTAVTVTDTQSGYSTPYPTYTINYNQAVATPIYFAVTIANSTAVPSDAATQIQNAIINAFAGGDGGPKARIGSTIYASRFYAPIAALGTWAQIVSLYVGTAANPTGNDVTMTIDQAPTVSAADISVTV